MYAETSLKENIVIKFNNSNTNVSSDQEQYSMNGGSLINIELSADYMDGGDLDAIEEEILLENLLLLVELF